MSKVINDEIDTIIAQLNALKRTVSSNFSTSDAAPTPTPTPMLSIEPVKRGRFTITRVHDGKGGKTKKHKKSNKMKKRSQ
jgi:hypothetical protein